MTRADLLRRIRLLVVIAGALTAAGAVLAAVAARRRPSGLASAAEAPAASVSLAVPPADPAEIFAQAQLRQVVSIIAAAVALLLVTMSVLGWLFGVGETEEVLARAGWLLIGAAAATALAVWLAQRPPLPRPTMLPMADGRVRLRWLLPGMMLLGVLALLNGGILGERFFPNVHYHAQMALFVFGISGVALGLGGVRRLSLRPAADAQTSRWWQREWVIVLAITLAALLVRAWGVESLLRLWRDETLFAEAVLELWDNPTIDTLVPVPGISSILGAFPYMQSLTIGLFGADLAGMRATTVLLGALTVPAVYVLAGALFNRKTALIAALILAAYPPHIHFSRLALYNIADPLFGTWALAFFALGLRRNRRLDWALAGTMLGLTHYFYEGGRLLFTPLLGLWLLAMLVITPARDGKRWRRHLPWSGLVTFGLAFALTIAPLYYTWVVQQRPFSPRYDETRGTIAFVNYLPDYWHTLTDDFALADLPRRLDNLAGRIPADFSYYYEFHFRPPLLHFLRDPDGSSFYYGGTTPLLLVYTLPFFLFGALLLLWRPRAPGAVLPLLWLLLTILGNSLIWQNNWSPRFVVAFPAVALLMAVGIVGALALLLPPPLLREDSDADEAAQTRQAASLRWRARLGVGLALTLAVLQVGYYFGTHLPVYNRQMRSDHKDYMDVAYRARHFPPGTEIFLVTDETFWEPHYFAFERLWGIDMHWQVIESDEARQRIIGFLLDHIESPRDVAVFIKPEDLALHHWLRDNFNIERPQYSPYDVPQFAQYALYYIDTTP
jgi:4-amino-4-deoxy-L-arabinose transferase-like glycosyltransferase